MPDYPWVPDGDLIRCKKHKISFGVHEQCPDCAPSILVDPATVRAEVPPGLATADEHELWHMQRSEIWMARADEVLADNVRVGDADPTMVAAKAEDTARKHRLHAAEFSRLRERKAYIEALRKERERIRTAWGGN